jgi:hypothetical protein
MVVDSTGWYRAQSIQRGTPHTKSQWNKTLASTLLRIQRKFQLTSRTTKRPSTLSLDANMGNARRRSIYALFFRAPVDLSIT